MKKLTQKQQAFAEHYLENGFNGTQAARKAGYQGSDNTLAQVATDNLKNPQIASRVRARIEGVAANADEVLHLLGDHLRADMADFADCFNDLGQLDLVKAQARGVSRLIRKLEVVARPIRGAPGEPTTYEYTTKIELHDAQGAAAKLIPVLGLKQAPAENERDMARRTEWANQKLREVMAALGLDESSARAWLAQKAPTAARYLM